jgi:hypothetical protein
MNKYIEFINLIKMKAAVKVKSYLTTTPIHSNPHTQ